MINYGVYGDIEVKLDNGVLEKDLGLGSLESYLKESRRPVEDAPVLGWFYKKIVKRVVSLPGDFLGDSLEEGLVKETERIYDALVKNKSLDNTLKSYRGEFKSFDASKEVMNKSKVYADLCFRPGLSKISGVYFKLFDKLEFLARKYDTDFVFVLGNHDLGYDLFKPMFDCINGLKHVHFIDRAVKKVKGEYIAGLGGSPELPKTLSSLSYVSNTSIDSFKKGRDALLTSCKGLSVDTLIMHKGYTSEKAKSKWGKLPELVAPFPDFDPIIKEVYSKLNPFYVFCGHWHEGGCFNLGKGEERIDFVNPGTRIVAWANPMDGFGVFKKKSALTV